MKTPTRNYTVRWHETLLRVVGQEREPKHEEGNDDAVSIESDLIPKPLPLINQAMT